MTSEIVRSEGAKCIRKAWKAIACLQTCPKDMRQDYVYLIVDTVVRNAFEYWWSKDHEYKLSDILAEYEEVYQWVVDDMIRHKCKFYPAPSQYKFLVHYMGGILLNL